MRKDCELEIIASPDSKCIGPYVGSCGVTMENHSNFSKNGTALVPGKLLMDTG